jgi:hypothetical protein
MSDLGDQLRSYIDSLAEPVARDEALNMPEPSVQSPRRRRQRVLVPVLAAALVLACATVVVLVRTGSSTKRQVVGAAARGTVLTVERPATCAEVLQPGDSLTFGAVLSNGSTACVYEHGGTTWTSVDTNGRSRDRAGTNEVLGSRAILPLYVGGVPAGRGISFMNVSDDVAVVHYTFCDGTTLDAAPMNTAEPRFVAVGYDSRLGTPGFQAVDANGRALSAASQGSTAPPNLKSCTVSSVVGTSVTWSTQPADVDGTIFSLAADAQTVVAVGARGGAPAIWSSPQLGGLTNVLTDPGSGTIDLVRAWSGGFVAVGNNYTNGSPATPGVPQHVVVWASPDGTTWTPADATSFAAPHPIKTGMFSIVRDVATHDGLLVAIGDVYTANKHQQDGFSPCIWTSRDALHWTRHIVDLGHRFDPYQDSIVWWHGRWVASGSAGKFPAVAWTSRDLVHWDIATITPQGHSRLFADNTTLYAAGGMNVGSTKKPVSRPTLWRSDDAKRWTRVLSLPSVAIGPPPATALFVSISRVGNVLVAVGLQGPGFGAIVVYESTDGTHWHPSPVAAIQFSTSTILSGLDTVRGQLVIAGNPQGGPETLWTAAAPGPS